MNHFEHTINITDTCQLRISGIWQILNGELEYYVVDTKYSHGGLLWNSVPFSILSWAGGWDKINDIAHNYITSSCVNADQPDTTTDLQQEHVSKLKNGLS